MRKMLSALAAALPLAGCAGYYGGGYGGGYYAGGPVAYDGFYDGFYGPLYDGYWGNDGFFYYRGGVGDRHFRRGDPGHFAHAGGPPPGGHFSPMHGNFNRGPGMRTPHFGGPGGGHGGGGFHGGGGGGGHGGHH